MIAHVYGEVVEKLRMSVIVDVNGVGYEVQTSVTEYDGLMVGSKVKLYTYHHVREQAQELYGFSTLSAKRLFELLITVQGVGPKAALAVMSISDSETVRSAIASGDSAFVARASGVGKKTAERVIVDLSEKVGHATVVTAQTSYGTVVPDEAMEALMALGYSLSDSAKVLEGIDTNISTEQRIRLALKEKF
jgi:holliday junction DNA helicase RuvA